MGGTGNLIYATLYPEDVAGVFSSCSVTDLATYYDWCRARNRGILKEIADAIESAYGGPPSKCRDRYAGHSTVLNHAKLTMPVFITHSTGDDIIPVFQSQQLAKAMGKSPNFQYREMPDGDHDSPFFANFIEGLDWLLSKLNAKKN